MGAAAVALLAVGSASAASMSPAEKVYADLAKLPAAARAAKIMEGAKKEGEVFLIDTVRGRNGKNYVKLFAKRYPFLKVRASELGSQDAAERILSEEAAGRHLTDAAMLATPDMGNLLRKNLAARFPTPETDRVLPRYKKAIDKENRWVPFYTLNHGISYNPEVIPDAQAPKSWEDLCKPQYKGLISFDPAETRFMVGLYHIMGEEGARKWIECIGKNDPIIQRGHTTRLMLMLAGDHGLAADQFLYKGTQLNRKNPKKAPFKVVYEAPIMTWAGGIFINRNTPRPYGAGLLGDWALSDESQKYQKSLLRGPLTLEHPFLTADAKNIILSAVDGALVDRLHGYWTKYVGRKK